MTIINVGFPVSQDVTGKTVQTGDSTHDAVRVFVIGGDSLPLPTGAATEATLSSINSKTPALGQALMAASSPVVIASDQTPVAIAGVDLLGAQQQLVTTTRGIIKVGLVDVNDLPARSTAFGQLQVAAPKAMLDYFSHYEVSAWEWGLLTATGGTVAHVPDESAARLSVTGTNASRAMMRTHQCFRYQAGRSLNTKLTIVHSDLGQTNQVREWGIFDDSDGLFFRLSGTTVSIVRRTSTSGVAVDNVVNQVDWNRDKFDGSGASGSTLALQNGNIYEIEFQWLGVGLASFFINGVLVHELLNPGSYPAPYMKTGTLPVSINIVNTGASVAGSMTFICCSVANNGGDETPEYIFGAFNPADLSTTATERAIISIRPKLTYNSITNRMLIVPKQLRIACQSGRIGWRLVFNPTLTGAAFASADALSGAEFDVAATTVTGGVTMMRGFLPNSTDSDFADLSQIFWRLGRHLHLDYLGTSQPILTLAAQNEAAGTSNVRGSFTWGEHR